MRRRTSDVWNYATKSSDRLSAICNQCNLVIKTSNFSTTGLIKHLRKVHKINIETPEPPPNKPNFPENLKKELHEIIVKAIVEDSRSFNDFRKPGIMKLFKKILPSEYVTQKKEILKWIRSFILSISHVKTSDSEQNKIL